MDLENHIKDLKENMKGVFKIETIEVVYKIIWNEQVLYLKESNKFEEKLSKIPSSPIFDIHKGQCPQLLYYKLGEQDDWVEVTHFDKNNFNFTETVKEYLNFK